MSIIFFIILAILLLGILITIHELGHFVAARITRIPVQEFAVGFGPKLFGWKSRKYETTFAIRAIPLGGYCAFYGEDDPEEGKKLEHPEWNINNFPVWRRFIVILMGPIMNFVLALVVSFSVYFFMGAAMPILGVTDVSPNTPAYSAGLQKGDEFVSINGEAITSQTPSDQISALIQTTAGSDTPAHIEVARDGEVLSFNIVPEYNEQENRYLVGITIGAIGAAKEKIPLTFSESIQNSWAYCLQMGKALFTTFANLLKTGEGADQLVGPVGTIGRIAQQTQQQGFDAFISLLIFISINLGLFNLFPIPGLDGSRLLFLIAEKVCSWFGVKISRKFEAIVHLTGFFLMIGIAIFFTYKDILRLFQ